MCHCFFVVFDRHHLLHRLVRLLHLLRQRLVLRLQRFLRGLEVGDSNPGLRELAAEVVHPDGQRVLGVGQASTEVLDLVLQQVILSLEKKLEAKLKIFQLFEIEAGVRILALRGFDNYFKGIFPFAYSLDHWLSPLYSTLRFFFFLH